METREPFDERGLAVIDRPRSALVPYAIATLGGLTLTFAALGGAIAGARGIAIAVGVLVTATAALGGYDRTLRDRRSARRVRGDHHGLFVDDRLVASRGSITRGMVVVDPDMQPRVRIERRHGGPIEIVMPSIERARALLHALHLDADASVARHFVAAPSTRSWERRQLQLFASLLLVMPAFAMGGATAARPHHPSIVGMLVAAAAMLGLVAMVARLVWPTRLSIGADGVHARWIGEEVFIPVDDIRDTLVVEEDAMLGMRAVVVRVFRKSGAHHDILVSMRRSGADLMIYRVQAKAATIAERIEEIVDARAEHRAPDSIAAREHLGSLTGDAKARVASLRDALARPDTFREATGDLARELLEVIEDATADVRTRVVAAAALSNRLDEHAKTRVAKVAEATASPRLRLAIDAAVRDDEAAIDEVLADVEAHEPKTRGA